MTVTIPEPVFWFAAGVLSSLFAQAVLIWIGLRRRRRG